MSKVYLSLGSNLGDRQANLGAALNRLEQDGFCITAQSSVYETAPRDFEAQPWFFNMVAAGETGHDALELLAIIQAIEVGLGRARSLETVEKGPRLIDIDILLFGDSEVEAGSLVVPHQRMLQRRFVLEPLLEIAPDLRDPRTGRLFREFLPQVLSQTVRKI